MMTVLTRASNNQPVTLGNQIASSGEGEVWETNLSGILAKIYHNPTPERIEKLKAMLANPPVDPMASQNHISIAFPQDLLKDGKGAYVGFLMPAVRDSRELTTVYNPSLRKKKAPGFNWYYLHVTALNTAWIIQALHEKGYVLGDIKPQNILVNDRALVAVIDTDSFQVRDSTTGKIYRCTVGSEGFTPVELLGKDFSATDQTEICDRFRLAVLIHYLLFGYHPFSGEWTGAGDSPDQTELIRQGYWYGGQNSFIRPSQNTIPLDVVHPELKRCFLQCFNDGHASPHFRPTAEEWRDALQIAVNQLTTCNKVNNHIYSHHYGKCYWCERVAKLGVDIFPGGSGTAKIPTTTKASKIAAKESIKSYSASLSSSAATTNKYIINPSTATQTVLSSSTVLFISTVVGALVILGGVSFFFYQLLKEQSLTQIRKNLNTEVISIEGKLEPVKQSMRDLAGTTELLSSEKALTPELYNSLILSSFRKRPPLTMGVMMGQTAYAVLPDRQWHGTYFYVDQKEPKQPGKRLAAPNDRVFQVDLLKEDNYPNQPYYKDSIALGKENWSEPYSWYGIPMTTFSVIIRDRSDKILGNAAIDVNLGALSDQISKSVIRNQGYFVLANERGTLLSYPPAPDRAKNQSSYETIPELKAIWSKLPQDKTQAGLLQTGGKFWAYERVPSTNWLMLAAVPEAVIIGPVLTITMVAGVLGIGLLLTTKYAVAKSKNRC